LFRIAPKTYGYDAAVGRFLSVDPLAEKFAAWSPYTYALDNPVRLVDRDGMEAEDEWEIIINKDGTSSTR